MNPTFIKLPDVIKKTSLSRSSIYSMSKSNQFPRPHRIGARAVAWSCEDVDRWIAEKMTHPQA